MVHVRNCRGGVAVSRDISRATLDAARRRRCSLRPMSRLRQSFPRRWWCMPAACMPTARGWLALHTAGFPTSPGRARRVSRTGPARFRAISRSATHRLPLRRAGPCADPLKDTIHLLYRSMKPGSPAAVSFVRAILQRAIRPKNGHRLHRFRQPLRFSEWSSGGPIASSTFSWRTTRRPRKRRWR